jgi:hypothetical protein
LGEGLAHGFDSDVEDEIPDGVPRARTFSLLMGWSNSSDEEEDEEEEDDVVEEQVVVTDQGDKYEYYDQNDFPMLPDDTAHVYLADLCRRIRAPLYAYDEILQWAQEAHLSGYRFPTNAPTYRSMLSSLRSRLCLSHLSHGTATIQKCGGGTLDFPIFDFASMFYDLIDDYRISPHLLINFECPNKPPSFNLQFLEEVHSGKWHRLTSRQLLNDANDVLSGIIFFFDRTHVSNKDKLSVHPLMFSLSIIPRWLRNQPFAWRPLGYFPKLPSAKKFGQNIDTLHRCLDVMLSGLVQAQRTGGLKAPVLAKDGREFRLCFKVPVCFVIGDVEGHDELCTRYGSHLTHRLCRECDCLTESSDNPDVVCTYIKASYLTELRNTNDIATLKALSFHNVTNAFDNVSFGANEYGIHRATPSEVLHSLQKGLYLYALDGFYSKMGGQAIIDFLECLVQRVSADCVHQSDRNMPRLKFANGIQSYANLQAHETTGVLLLIVISLHCKIGWDKNSRSSTTNNSFVRSRHCNVRHVREYLDLFETLLCMEQWIKLPSVRKADVTPTGGPMSESSAKAALRIAVKKFVNTVNRSKGMGMKLTKVHSLLHVPDDVAMFGSGKNWDSGPSESNHKENVKRKAALTNLCKDTLEDQVATRFEESLVLEHAKGIIMGNEEDNVDTSPLSLPQASTGSRFKLTISSTEGVPYYDSIRAAWDGKKNSKFGPESTLPLPPQEALEHLLQLVGDAYNNYTQEERPTSTSPLCVDCFTDHKTTIAADVDRNQIYRAHPAYRGCQPWNDWVYVQYLIHCKDAQGRVTNVFEDHLSKILIFVDFTKSLLPNMTDIVGYVSPGTYALVQTLEEQPVPVRNSVLLSTCILSNDYYLVPTSSFRKPAFVVDNVGCENRSLFVVPPMDEWAELF